MNDTIESLRAERNSLALMLADTREDLRRHQLALANHGRLYIKLEAERNARKEALELLHLLKPDLEGTQLAAVEDFLERAEG